MFEKRKEKKIQENDVAVDSVTCYNKTDKKYQDVTDSTNIQDGTCCTNSDETFQGGAYSIKTD